MKKADARQRVVGRGINDESYFRMFVQHRLEADDYYYGQKEDNLEHISNDKLDEIKKFWEPYIPENTGVLDFKMYEVYSRFCYNDDMLKYYVPDGFFYAIIDEYYSNPLRSVPIDDKNLYDLLFHDVNRPKTLFRILDDKFYDVEGDLISIDDAKALCADAGQVVMKAAVSSYGGHGVKFWDKDENGNGELQEILTRKRDFKSMRSARGIVEVVAQTAIKQHKDLAKINSSSVNTIRVMTMMWEGYPEVVSSVLRMGINGSKVDNASSGGIVCGIKDDGTLRDYAVDAKANVYTTHPDGEEFAGIKVPSYYKVLELALKLQQRMASASRLISWDFAVDENGEPMLIEMNISYGELDFHQMCNGPIFGDRLEDILLDVLENSYTLKRIL